MIQLINCQWIAETMILVLLGLVQVYQGFRKPAPMWVPIGFLLIVLPFVHLWAQYAVLQKHTGPVYGTPWTDEQATPGDRPAKIPLPSPWSASSSDSSSGSEDAKPTPPPPMKKRSIGRDGWNGGYSDQNVTLKLTIPPADSQRQHDVAAPFAGANPRKVGLVGIISLTNRSPHEMILETAGVVLHLVDGTQMFAADPSEVIASAGPQRAEQLKSFKPPYHVPAGGKLSLGVVFVPGDTDLSSLDHLRLKLDGKWIEVR